MLNLHPYFAQRANYAINPTPELDLRSSRAVLPARVIAALALTTVTIRRLIAVILVLLAPQWGAAGGYESELNGALSELAKGLGESSEDVRYEYEEVSVPDLLEQLDTRLYKVNFVSVGGFTSSEKLFALRSGKLVEFGETFGGHGLMSALVHRGCLYYTFSWGSGVHRTQLGLMKVDRGKLDIWESDGFVNSNLIVEEQGGKVVLVLAAYNGFNKWEPEEVVGVADSVIPEAEACRSER